MAIVPIIPDEVVHVKQQIIPDGVFQAFNELIAAGWNGTQSVVLQREAIAKIGDALNKPDFPIGYLDIEDIYRAAGWRVEYYTPGYNEDYSAKFIFKKK